MVIHEINEGIANNKEWRGNDPLPNIRFVLSDSNIEPPFFCLNREEDDRIIIPLSDEVKALLGIDSVYNLCIMFDTGM